MKFKFLEHTADIKFQAFGKNIEEVFENSALALKESISEDEVKEKIKKKISISARGIENALQNFLEEFLFLFETEEFLPGKISEMKIKEKKGVYSVMCRMTGDKAGNYEIRHHVKAVTFNDIFVRKEKGKWVGQVVLDV